MIEDAKIDEKVIEGKVVFSTFHCVKGRQRSYVKECGKLKNEGKMNSILHGSIIKVYCIKL